ncbi:MAG TPA: helix-turn-helix transcriptional regulator [Spirochaetales bacterium]|nr:helix-turn-helix transcriptional regulator [Spirochaetales bacterium]HRY53641.1 helix-turn-helix transcriptional regulator [Spirochaetia bacterium]HRZ63728.1 helix-turn-helix transcriptional regulator [Spirochaetia bacterium]
MDRPLTFLIKIIVAGNGLTLLFFGIAQLTVRRKRAVHYWGSGFFIAVALAFALAAAESMRLYLSFPHIILIDYLLLALSGPLLFGYFRRLDDPDRKPTVRELLLFVQPALFLASMLPFYRLGAREKIAIFDTFMSGREREHWLLFLTCQTADLWLLFCSLLFFFGKLRAWLEDRGTPAYPLWLSVLIAVCALLHLFSVFFSVQTGWLFLFLSLALLALALYLLHNSEFFLHDARVHLPSRYLRSKLENVDLEDRKRALERLMEKERLYLNEALTLAELGERLSLSAHQLSEFLNAELGTTFKAYVNGYRVREAQRLLREPGGETILEIALNSGFNSKATFNKVFREATGMTPSEFRSAPSPPP